MQNVFNPTSFNLSREAIAETINLEVDEAIELDDPRLTDELCQKITNSWASFNVPDRSELDEKESPFNTEFWWNEDEIHEEWSAYLSNIFNCSTESYIQSHGRNSI